MESDKVHIDTCNSTKKRIMEASLSLFLKKGFDNVSLREIKKEANITSGGFYHYFKSKDDLLIEVEKKYILNHFDNAMNHIKTVDGSFDQKMRQVLEYIISYDYVSKNDISRVSGADIYRDYYLLYLESIRRNKEDTSILKKFNKDLFEFNLELIEKAKKQVKLVLKLTPRIYLYFSCLYLKEQ